MAPRARRRASCCSSGKRYAWTIPLSLPVTRRRGRDARARRRRRRCATRPATLVGDPRRDLEVFDWDKPKYVQRVYGTDRVRPSGRPHRRERPAHASSSAARSARCRSRRSRVRRVHALAAHDAHADPRPQVGARARLPDAQPAAPRARVRAGRRRRAAHARGLLHRRRAQPAGRRAQGRRRARRDAHALLPRAARSTAARPGRQGRGAVEAASATTSPRSSSWSASTSRCSTAARRKR